MPDFSSPFSEREKTAAAKLFCGSANLKLLEMLDSSH